MGIIYIKDVKKLYNELLDLQEEFNDVVESFIENPVRTNRNKVREVYERYSTVRRKLHRKISDFWCKGE